MTKHGVEGMYGLAGVFMGGCECIGIPDGVVPPKDPQCPSVFTGV